MFRLRVVCPSASQPRRNGGRQACTGWLSFTEEPAWRLPRLPGCVGVKRKSTPVGLRRICSITLRIFLWGFFPFRFGLLLSFTFSFLSFHLVLCNPTSRAYPDWPAATTTSRLYYIFSTTPISLLYTSTSSFLCLGSAQPAIGGRVYESRLSGQRSGFGSKVGMASAIADSPVRMLNRSKC